MSNKLKALIQTIGFFAIAAVGAILFVFGTLWIPIKYILYALIFGMFAFGFWVMYQVNLNKLDSEWKEK
jgi:CHASE2 domain-containing sensor protein